MSQEIDFSDDIIDLRDVVERLDDLSAREEDPDDELDEGEQDELAELRSFKEAFEDGGGYDLDDCARNEPTLINERYWQRYAEDFADDIGLVDSDSVIYHYIDWKKWADDLLNNDYTEVTFDAHTYYLRAW